jgi:hypothetical protein
MFCKMVVPLTISYSERGPLCFRKDYRKDYQVNMVVLQAIKEYWFSITPEIVMVIMGLGFGMRFLAISRNEPRVSWLLWGWGLGCDSLLHEMIPGCHGYYGAGVWDAIPYNFTK